MSQLQLANKLNIGPSAIGMYEQGRRTPNIDLLVEMANLFEVSLNYLITGAESPYTVSEATRALTQPPCLCKACCVCCQKRKAR